MTVGGSQQLRLFRCAIRAGATIESAAEAAGIAAGEARLIVAEDARNPPPAEAFELLSTPATTPEPKEADMARGRKARDAEPQPEEIKTKDFGLAVRLYRQDIKPAQSKVGEYAQEQSTAYKAIKKSCHIQPAAAKLAFKLDDMEEAKRDDFLRCFTGLLKELNIPLQSADLVDMAEGKAASPPPLVTMGVPSDGMETDLADAALDDGDPKDDSDGDDGAFEASDTELAKQAGRGAARKGSVSKIGAIERPLH